MRVLCFAFDSQQCKNASFEFDRKFKQIVGPRCDSEDTDSQLIIKISINLIRRLNIPPPTFPARHFSLGQFPQTSLPQFICSDK